MSARPGDPSFVAPPDLTGQRHDWHAGAVEKKAHRLLITGSVHIAERRGDHIVAHVRGDMGYYAVRFIHGQWSCDCPSAREGQRCSHRAAVELVTGDERPT